MRFLARRWKWLLFFLVLAAAGVGLRWWRQPPGLKIAGTFPVADTILIPRQQGFLIRKATGAFTLRDWHTGTVVWRVRTTVLPFELASKGFLSSNHSFSLSPDGQTFALLLQEGRQAQVRVWQDGRLQAETALSFSVMKQNASAIYYAGGVQALDGGRVLCWRTVDEGTPIVAVEGGKIIARGRIPNRYAGHTYPGMAWERMASDGKLLVGRNGHDLLLARITIANAHITATPYMRYGAEGAQFEIFPGEVLVMGGGEVITRHGIIHDPHWALDYNTPVGDHVLQSSRLYNPDRFRVLTPVNMKSWQCIVAGNMFSARNGGTSPDGGYAAFYGVVVAGPPAYPRAVNLVLQRLPDALRRRAERTRPSEYYLALYRKPGRLVARQQLNEYNRLPETDDNCYQAYPSPDGKTITVLANRHERSHVLLLKVAKW